MTHQKWIALFAIVPVLQLSCTVDRVAGNGSQTGNPMIAGELVDADGRTPACNAAVYLRKRSATAFPAALMKRHTDTVAAARTSCDGKFTIDSIDTGLYIVEGSDGGNNLAFIDSVAVRYFDSTVILPPARLKPAAAIKGSIRLSEGGDPRKVLVMIPALDRFLTADSGGGFRFERLAEGRYALRILPTLDDYGVFDTLGVAAVSAETTDIGRIDLPFAGIPAVKNIMTSYDTLRQRVTVRWSRPNAARVKSFNVYRRTGEPATAEISQRNVFPVIDTLFIDSLCEPTKTYEYFVTAVDAYSNEGTRGPGAKTFIALYDIIPKNVAMTYDTIRQTIRLQWSNPDTGLVNGYNIYRRNIDLNETFWTPFNTMPIPDTSFTDSTFNLCPNYTFLPSGSTGDKEPGYEYCIGALIKNVREGARSIGVCARISFKYITPALVRCAYDTSLKAVELGWSLPDTTLVKSFNVFRKDIDQGNQAFSQINETAVADTVFVDSSCRRNKNYEYRIASIVDGRAEVRSEGILIRTAPGE